MKRTINGNKYKSKVPIQAQSTFRLLTFLGVNRPFFRYIVLLFENIDYRTGHTRYFMPSVEIRDCNVMVDGQNFFV